jgi:hypothetical protein
VGGASARDVVCAIERAMARFESDVREIIYVYCENDFRVGEPYGRPEEVVAWLKRFAQQRSIERIVMVYAPYIYNVAPHILGRTTLTYVTEREALLARSKEAGFVVVDIGELAATEVQRRKTEFAALSLFVDHVHLSVYGTQMLAQRILDSRL